MIVALLRPNNMQYIFYTIDQKYLHEYCKKKSRHFIINY